MMRPANAWFGLWAAAGRAPSARPISTRDEIRTRRVIASILSDPSCGSRPLRIRPGQQRSDRVEPGAIGRLGTVDPAGDVERAARKRSIHLDKLGPVADR